MCYQKHLKEKYKKVKFLNNIRQKSLNLEQNNYAWAEGQLKVFIWILIGYAYLKKIDIGDMVIKILILELIRL